MATINKFSKINRESLSSKNHFVLINLFLIILIILGGIFYLLQVNIISSYSFKMKELNKKLEDLKVNNTQMEKLVTSLESIENLYQLASLEMIKTAQVDYLIPPQTSVAIKK